MMAKPMKTLELHYPMIQFLINFDMTASVNWDLPLRQKSIRFCLCRHSLKSGLDGICEGRFSSQQASPLETFS